MKQKYISLKIMIIIVLSAILLSSCTVSGAASPLSTSSSQPSVASPATQVSTGPANPSKLVTVLETGSSLLYPLFNTWAPAIKQAYPNIIVQTASTGSGTGIAQAVSGVVQIGASDAYMSDAQLANSPGIVNIPLAISAQQINFNLPGISTLNLSGTVLAGIFTGSIRYWDDQAIKADNPDANLPHNLIIPVHRTDGSGDTFLFTQYLSSTDAAWQNTIGFNTSITWPSTQGAIGAVGNSGVVQTLAQTPYSIGYVGISFLDQATSHGLGTAALKNQSGIFVQPNSQSISAAASAMVVNTPADERISLVYAPGIDSYPIINYEYAVVQTRQSDPLIAGAIRTILLWAISPNGGNSPSFLDAVHFLPLPSTIVTKSEAQIDQIQ
jgi:phosphate transport system substrate-binding protein